MVDAESLPFVFKSPPGGKNWREDGKRLAEKIWKATQDSFVMYREISTKELESEYTSHFAFQVRSL